jgi:hypothetical protein
MTFIYLEDDWRDESTEGPGVDILQTKYVKGTTFTIVKYCNEPRIILKVDSREIIGKFISVDAAKQAVTNFIKNRT